MSGNHVSFPRGIGQGAIVIALVGLSFSGSASAEYFTLTENFATDPGWIGMNNRTAPQNFGFSNTNNVGLGAGEMGGTVTANNFQPFAYYGDDVGSMDMSQDITFSGTLLFQSAEFGNEQFGFFNDPLTPQSFQPGSDTPHSISLLFDGRRTAGVDLYVQSVDANGNRDRRVVAGLSVGTPHTFSVTYSAATTRITYQIDNQAPDNFAVGTTALFNRFGLFASPGLKDPVALFFDNLTYSSALPGGLAGDFNSDGAVNATDIDLLCDRINAGTGPVSPFDVNNDGSVNQADVNFEVTNILETKFGDTDTDGDVDLNDLGNLASGFGQPGEKRWSKGNFDCDTDVDLNDLGTLATNFQSGRAAAFAQFEALVPEPASAALISCAAIVALVRRRTIS